MSTQKSDFDGNLYGSYSFIHDYKPYKGNSQSSDSIPDAKWWLNHHGLGTGGENLRSDEYYYTYTKNDTAFCRDVQLESTLDDYLLSTGILTGLDCRRKKTCSELDSRWIGLKKIGPWWHGVDDKDDFTSLISRMSSHHDRWMSVEKVSGGCEICCNERMKDRSVGRRGLTDCMLPESHGTLSSTGNFDSSNNLEPCGDLSRAQLLEALCHSQTRAREVEKSAQDACDEKGDIINLFFQQASCLFAYRQWVHLLQLEALYLRLTSQNRPGNQLLLSRARNKDPMLRRNGLRAGKMKRAKTRYCYIRKCAFAFAVCFGLASAAGLLVGWTIGWFFPAL